MKNLFFVLIFFIFYVSNYAQVSSFYSISFENAVHHEAEIKATFKHLKTDIVEFRMSRTSPGRYALHEFVKNVYNVKVTDGAGKILKTSRPNPYAWHVTGHDGTIQVEYTLFANRGDGTYAQIDESHAHLNIPATFMYVPDIADNEIEIAFNIREDLNWKIATQLKHLQENTYYAKDLQYFMDSPTEISDFNTRSFEVISGNRKQIINFVLHGKSSDALLDAYVSNVKKIVFQEEKVFGELPTFDYNTYTFLACYLPNASGDGMEHRNSTILTSAKPLAKGGFKNNIGTVSHEFFHCWNVERIRPNTLEPFDFEDVNMSGELWFAEGFTSYYTSLILCRAGIISPGDYINGLQKNFNYVWNSPALQFFNPIEMSQQAPLVDAASSIDEVNRENTFISYYSYGSMLGLALDLSLREQDLNLDNYMKLIWNNYGKTAVNYSVNDLHRALNSYAGEKFGDTFFNNYIYKSDMPNYKKLFESVGVKLIRNENKVYFGASLKGQIIIDNPIINSPAYISGLAKGDKIIRIGDILLNEKSQIAQIINSYKPNDKVKIIYERYGVKKEILMTLLMDPTYTISLNNDNGKPDKKTMNNRDNWLQAK